MIGQEITVVLRSLFTTDEQTQEWMAAAHTAQTRARIRRWAKIETIGMTSVETGERAIAHPGSGDDQTWYHLRINAALPDGTLLRRRLHLEGESFERRVGGSLRFRHNTLDPDELDDVHFAGWIDKKQPRSRRERSRR